MKFRVSGLSAVCITTAGLLFSHPASAGGDVSGVGLGVVVGDPTGIAFAWRPGGDSYVQAALGWNLRYDRLALNVDYIFTLTTLHAPDAPRVSFPVYVGVGGRLRLDDDNWNDWGDSNWDHDHSSLGVRVPIGISLVPSSTPIDVYFELAPVVELIPATGLDLDAGLGARFYF